MPSSNKLTGADRLSQLFENIVVANNNDIPSINSTFGAIMRDLEVTAAATAAVKESRKAPGKKQGGNVANGRDNGKIILSQDRGYRKPVTRSMDNPKFEPFKDDDSEKSGLPLPAPTKALQKKIITSGKHQISTVSIHTSKPQLTNAKESFSPHFFEIRPKTNSQVGMFAIQAIPKETEILREAPLILGGPTWPGREAAYNKLSRRKKVAVDSPSSLCICGKKPELCLETPLMKHWAVNSFEMNPLVQVGNTANDNCIYDKASGTNHACKTNCSRAFNSEHSISIRAMRDIRKGEEITHNYGAYGTASFRAGNIAERWKFICTCNACIKGEYVPETGYEEYQHNKILFCFQFPHLVPLGAETAEEAAISQDIMEWAEMIEKGILEAEAYWYAHTDGMVSRRITRLRFTREWTIINESPTRNFLVNGHERFLKENNKFNLSENVIELYIWRAIKALRAEVNRCHPMFIRKHS
ncbi:hypothetical protein ACHAO8_001584 [Botrytis cinerea]